MKNEQTVYQVSAAARSFVRFLDMRPQWQQRIMRWCMGYKACHYLEMLRRSLEDLQ
mgnify:CR=1 FL=1